MLKYMCNINMCLHAYIVFYTGIKGFLGGSAVKKKKKICLPIQEMQVQSLGQEDGNPPQYSCLGNLMYGGVAG